MTFGRSLRGRPAAYATAHEQAWKAAVRRAFRGCRMPEECAVAVEVTFELDEVLQLGRNEPDLDNLVKTTIDAMDEVLGRRSSTGNRVEADDVRVARITATKRHSALPGAHIIVSQLPSP